MKHANCAQKVLMEVIGGDEESPGFKPYDEMSNTEKATFDCRQGISPGDREKAEIRHSRPIPMARRFQAFKISICGNQIRREYQKSLTLDEARAYPLGQLEDEQGAFMWAYSLMNDYPCNSKR